MKATPLLISLACSALWAAAPAWAQTAPAKPAAKSAAKAPAKAASAADGKTLALGGGSGGTGKLLTRDELRACLAQEETIRKRLEAHEALRAPLDQEKAQIGKDQDALRTERAGVDALKTRADAFSARARSFTTRVETWTKGVEAHNANKNGSGAAYEKNLAALNKEREDITREQAELEAERKAIQDTTMSTVTAYNAKAQALDTRVQDWNQRNGQWNEASAALETERKGWVGSCADRRYREDDEIAIRNGK
jgi:chromosome segregation ATPase